MSTHARIRWSLHTARRTASVRASRAVRVAAGGIVASALLAGCSTSSRPEPPALVVDMLTPDYTPGPLFADTMRNAVAEASHRGDL